MIFYSQDNSVTIQYKSLYDHFTLQTVQPSTFLRELEQTKITEEQSEELLKQIIQFWQKKYIDTQDRQENLIIQKKLNSLYRSIDLLPNAGNAKMFWKWLLLQFDPLIMK